MHQLVWLIFHCFNPPPGLVYVNLLFHSFHPKGVFTLGDARLFFGLASKIPPLGSMLNFDADVKKTTARHQCENHHCANVFAKNNFSTPEQTPPTGACACCFTHCLLALHRWPWTPRPAPLLTRSPDCRAVHRRWATSCSVGRTRRCRVTWCCCRPRTRRASASSRPPTSTGRPTSRCGHSVKTDKGGMKGGGGVRLKTPNS